MTWIGNGPFEAVETYMNNFPHIGISTFKYANFPKMGQGKGFTGVKMLGAQVPAGTQHFSRELNIRS